MKRTAADILDYAVKRVRRRRSMLDSHGQLSVRGEEWHRRKRNLLEKLTLAHIDLARALARQEHDTAQQ